MKKPEINIVSMSGGKDSTATALYSLEIRSPSDDFRYVFADTGHEHQATYDYLDYLESVLPLKIERISANFDKDIARKRRFIKANWGPDLYDAYVADGLDHDTASARTYADIVAALSVLHPTGNPFLDLCLWKGRFPSTKRRFCSEQLKHMPITEQVMLPALDEYERIVSWQGVRADESLSRALLPAIEEDANLPNTTIFRPILSWTADNVFAMHKRHNIKWNPLYSQGMGRVGCMPCIHARKDEMSEIARRFPAEIERVAQWEKIVSLAAKRGASTFMDARVTAKMLNTGTSTSEITPETHGINTYVDYSRTARGGRQIDLIKAIDATDESPLCSSIYGLCE